MQIPNRHIAIRNAVGACATAALVLLLGHTVGAGSPLRTMNHLTFDRAVALPGVTLPAGSYTFERLEPGSDVVRVTDRAGRRIYFTGFTVRVLRPPSMPDTVTVVLGEAPRGSAVPIRAWYPRGIEDGHEFIYR